MMARTTDRDTATRIVTPDSADESMLFPHVAVYVHTHHPGEQADAHTHAEDHVLVMRSGTMRWSVEGQTVDATAGTVIVAPAGVPHSFEVIGDEPVNLLCIESPNPELDPTREPAPQTTP